MAVGWGPLGYGSGARTMGIYGYGAGDLGAMAMGWEPWVYSFGVMKFHGT